MTVRALADLGQGPEGGSSSCACRRGGASPPTSPLQPGANVYVAEASGGRWLHVRIDYREYSIPWAWPKGS